MNNKKLTDVTKYTNKDLFIDQFTNNGLMTDLLTHLVDNNYKVFTVKIKDIKSQWDNAKTVKHINDSIVAYINGYTVSIQWNNDNSSYTYFIYENMETSATYKGDVKRFKTIINRINKLDKGTTPIELIQKKFQRNFRILSIHRFYYTVKNLSFGDCIELTSNNFDKAAAMVTSVTSDKIHLFNNGNKFIFNIASNRLTNLQTSDTVYIRYITII